MTDIVERLRNVAYGGGNSVLCYEAADEIERLRAALFKIQCEQLDRGTNENLSAKEHCKLAMKTRDEIISLRQREQKS